MTGSAPTVGVVIPVYRCTRYVRGCLESVLAQTRPVDAIVLVDDRGGDDSIDVAQSVLREHDGDFTLITQPRNGGLGRARNTGLRALDTDLVWFLDSDDTADPSFVETLTRALRGAEADFAVCRTRRVDESGRVLQIDESPAPAPVVTGAVYARELLAGRAKAYACTKLYRRALLGESPWAEDQAYEDLTPNLRIALAAERVAMVDTPLYGYLYREDSLSTALRPSTFDLFTVGDEVREMTAAADGTRDHEFVAFWYRQILISVAHVAMRADHAASTRPELYDEAIARVRAGIDLRDLPVLLGGRQFRSAVFAVMLTFTPALYSAILRLR
ncbi:MAG: glycosyltransferase family 2 protein [Gordonia sp. (in: high G+C Gram-positive bacteria)]|uniref:glycosyltransferase family 2 protein n=1 Tax=Gordonia sp. (in: high G+C Gram-positive bacteria) TaxID=84139 RepID=UPI0039E51E45